MTQLTILDKAKNVFKNNKKYAAMACAGAIVGSLAAVSIPSVSYANDIDSSQSSFNEWSAMTNENTWDMSPEEYTAYEKEQFQKDYGTEDKFQTTYEDDQIKEEINGATGVIRYTNKTTGRIAELDYFKTLDQQLELANLTKDEYMSRLEELAASEKEQFQKDYGTEDKFQTTYENDRIKEEINGATGVIRTIDKKTGEVSDWDFFKALDEELEVVNQILEEYYAANGQL